MTMNWNRPMIMQIWPPVVRTTKVKYLGIGMVRLVPDIRIWPMDSKGTIPLAQYPADKSTWWVTPQLLVEVGALVALMVRLIVWRTETTSNSKKRSRCKLILWPRLKVETKTNNIVPRSSKTCHSTTRIITLGPIHCRLQISWYKSLLLDLWAISTTMKSPLIQDLLIKRSSEKW